MGSWGFFRGVFLCGGGLGFGVGVEVRIRRRHQGADILAPGDELGAEGGDFVGVLRGEVVFFADVLRDIVELHGAVFEPFDELPVAVADGAVGRAALVAVVRIVPIERLAARGALAFQLRQETDAIAMLGGKRGETGELEEGRIIVGADDGGVAGCARFRDTGGGDEPGDARAALVGPAFAAAERRFEVG